MRNLLLLALLLYDIIALATRSTNYDYDDYDGNKRQHIGEDRRIWRQKTLLKPMDVNHNDWNDRQRQDYDGPRYLEDIENKNFDISDRQRELDPSYVSRGQRHYDEFEKISNLLPKSIESGHPLFLDKEPDKKPIAMNCERQHERFEPCFAGCASITCDNPRERLRPCYPFCEAGCICLNPYVRDDRTHKCVLPDECTKGLKGIPDLGDDI